MEEMVLVIAVLGVGYVLGVWTACVVFWPAQREYEEVATRSSTALSSILSPVPGDPPAQPPRRL
ncbi:MAG: hypothetical protein WB682_10300 [Candidatus Dormiibacterota bacterium]